MNRFALIALVPAAFFVGCQTTNDGAKPVTAAVESSAKYASFGEAVNPSADATPVATVLGDTKDFEGKPIRVTGTVSKVCERKGCWLQISDAGQDLFVKFTCPVEGRLVPMDAIGKKAIVQGELAIKEVSEADARHIAEEGGKTPAEVAKIVGPQKQITLKSPGAIVFGVTK